MNKGELSITASLGISVLAVAVGSTASYFANQIATNDKIASVAQVAAVTANSVDSIKENMKDIKEGQNIQGQKLDQMLIIFGQNPTKFNSTNESHVITPSSK